MRSIPTRFRRQQGWRTRQTVHHRFGQMQLTGSKLITGELPGQNPFRTEHIIHLCWYRKTFHLRPFCPLIF